MSAKSWPQWTFYLKGCVHVLGAGRQNKRINTQGNFKSNAIKKTQLDCANAIQKTRLRKDVRWWGWEVGLEGWRGGCSGMRLALFREQEVRETRDRAFFSAVSSPSLRGNRELLCHSSAPQGLGGILNSVRVWGHRLLSLPNPYPYSLGPFCTHTPPRPSRRAFSEGGRHLSHQQNLC